jgi:hypothetical protein
VRFDVEISARVGGSKATLYTALKFAHAQDGLIGG